MNENPATLDAEAETHRPPSTALFAASLFNGAWILLENPSRAPDDDLRMIHMAHASRYQRTHLATTGVAWAVGSGQCGERYSQ